MRLIPHVGPQRIFGLSTLVNAIGSGIYLTAGVLYFTQAVRLPAAQVGLGLSIAGLLSLAVGFVVGHVADRYSPRSVYALTLVGRGITMAGFALANSFWSFLVLACLGSAAQTAGFAARSPIIKHYGGDRPQQFRASLRAVTNIGIAVGALLAGWTAQVDTDTAYRLIISSGAVLFLASASIVLFVPSTRAEPPGEGPRWVVLRDYPYLTITALDGLMAIQFKVLTVAIPLWLVYATSAPHWLIAGTMLINTLMVIAFQVPISRGVDSPPTGGLASRKAGFAFLVSCSVIPLSAGAPSWAAASLVTAAIVIHSAGELWHAAAGFELSFALAPSQATGQYLGVFGMGTGLAEVVGPILLVWLCIHWGGPGWYIVGALLALAGLTTPAAVRWAVHTR